MKTTLIINNMKGGIIYLPFIVMLLQVGDAYAQGELWGTSYGNSKIFKVDGSNPSLANYVNVYDFAGTEPWACVTPGGNGKLYGTTSLGGSSNLGVLFEYDPATSVYTKKVDLDGFIGDAMTLAPNGKLYGTITIISGGIFVIESLFEYDPSANIYTKKVDFNSSSGQGSGPLALANNGKLYGMNGYGGSFGFGVIYEYDYVTNVFTKKVDLNAATGTYPNENSGLVLAGNGKFYGVTSGGGVSNAGVIFEYDPATSAVTKKYDFISDSPDGSDARSLVLAGNGKIYGATWAGGTLGLGVIFEYDYVANSYIVKHNLVENEAGAEVRGLTLSGNGKIYGVTNIGGGFRDLGQGALFEYDPASGSFTTKIVFDRNPNLPSLMVAGLVYVIPQSISFNIPDKSYGDPPFTISFTGGESGIPVVFTSNNHTVATVSGNTVTIVGPGTVTISASQAGTGNYLSAPNVSQTFTVHNRVNQTITFTTLADKNVGDAAFDLTATASSSLPVSYVSSNLSVATVSGNTVTIVGGGTTTITASQEGNASYYAATPVTQILNVNKLNQTITFGPLADKSVGDASFDLTPTASSALAVSYASSNTSVATVSGHTVSVVGPGTTIITASQAGNTQFNAAALVSQTLTVNKLNQTITFAALADTNLGDPDFNLTATASSPLAISYVSSNTSVATVSGNTVSIVGAGTTIITALQAGNIIYNAATPVSQTLTVNKSNQIITFSALADRNIGGANFDLTATASSALPVSYTSSHTSVTTVSGNSVTIVGSGTTIITASQAGNSSYNAATPVSQTLTVNKSNQTITFSALADKNIGGSNFNLTATASSALPVSYASSNPSVATISGNTVTIIGNGTTIITATQAGSSSYNAATPVSRTLTVNKLDQTIGYFVGRQTYFMGEGPFDLIPTASSGLPLTFTSSANNVATVSGSTMTIVGAGTATITATQSGNDSFNAAMPLSLVITVSKQNQAISWVPLPPKNMGDVAFNLPSTSTAGLPITYISSNPLIASISGNTVTIVAAGTVNITATQQGNDTYNAAATVTQQLIINKLNQAITFNSLSSKTMADAAFDLTGIASSGLPLSYVSSNTNVATVSGSTVIVVGYGATIITASQPGDAIYNAAESVPRSLTVTRVDQSITFNPIASKNVGDPAFNLTATANSTDQAVFYTSSNEAVATVSGNAVTIVGAGTTAITASNSGDWYYNPATPVTRTLTVNKSNQTITFNELADKHVGDANFNLNGTASSLLSVNYTSSNPSVATVSGNTVTIVGIGTTIITASQAGNANYNAAPVVSQTLTVGKTNQAITFNALADKNVGDGNFDLTATASSSLAVSYSSSNPAVATVVGNVVTIVGAGSTTITASQAGNANYGAAPDISQPLTVNKGNQIITFGALSSKTFGDIPFTLTGTASSGLAVSYVSSNTSVATVSGSTLTIVGAGSATITAIQAGNANYSVAISVPQTLTVSKANQVITFTAIPDKTVGDATFNLTATASSGLPVTYLNGNAAVATLSGSTVTLVGAGTTSFLARQTGNSNYNAATPVAQSLIVNKLNQSITFNLLPQKNVGDAPFDLTATASSGLPVSYISSNTLVATISGSTLTIVGGGSATINAMQVGNDSYNSAQTAAVQFTVNKLNQAITFLDLPAKTVGDAPFNLTATASSGLPVIYSSNNPSVATISGNTVTIVGAGTATITATQAGNANYNLATPTSRLLTVTKLNQTITFTGLAPKNVGDAAFNLTATADSGLPVSFTSSNPSVATISGSTVTIVGGGSTIITALQPGNTTTYNAAISVTQMLTVNKADQTINFSALANKTMGDVDFNLVATASSSLPVSYASSNASVATISGNTVTIMGGGTTIITASQSGNGSYNAAPSVTQTLTVDKSNQTITFNILTDKNVDDAAFNLSATASSGLPVSYASSNTAVATVSGNTVSIVGAGTTIITASQPGNIGYNAAASVTQMLTVNKSNHTITFNTLADKTVGDPIFSLSATATSGLTVSYVSSNTSVATIAGSTVTIIGAGTTIITASQAGSGNYNAAAPVSQTLTVHKSDQIITFNTLADKNVGDANFDLSATTSSGLTVSYVSSNPAVATISGNTLTIVGAGTTIITASQAGNGHYNAATPVSQTLTINKSNQTITFNALADKNVGDPAFNLSATTTSGLTASYVSSNTAVATVSENTVTIISAGTTIITALQAGNGNYNAATPVSQTLTVNKSNQTITFNALADKNVGDPAFNLSATTALGLTVSYVSSNTAVATVSGNTVTIISAGTTIITALQAGNGNYNAATPVSQTFTVNKSNQTITFNVLASHLLGDPDFTLTATASSGLPVSYTSTNTSVATISGDIVTIVGTGTTVITASQPGNTSYYAATTVSQPLTVTVGSKADQTISFAALPDKILGDDDFSLTATASSGLPVSYVSSNESVATVSGNIVSIVGAGITIITASQPGNASYNAATDVPRTLTVNKIAQTVTFSPLSNKIFGDPAFTLSATASSGLPVTYVSSNPAVAVVSGDVVTILGAGNSVITALQSGNPNYLAADGVSHTLTVNKRDQTITFASLADKVMGDGDFILASATTSGLPVTYVSSDLSVATISGNVVTIVGPGTTMITASQSGNTNYNTALNVQQTLTVNTPKADQTITFHALADKTIGDATFELAATSSSGLPVAYVSSNPSVATISGNTVTIVAVGTTIITALQPGNANYNAAASSLQALRVKKMGQTLTFDVLTNRSPGDEPFELSAAASSGLVVHYTSSNLSVATVSGATVTIVGTGTTVITASQSGDASYDAASDVARALTVTSTKLDQTITFNSLDDKLFGDAAFDLAATSTSGLGISYASNNPSVATISGSQLTIVGTGTTMITASQPGNATYNAAAAVARTLTVNKRDQSISFAVLADKTAGDESFSLTASATSGLPVSYSSTSDKVAIIGGRVSIVKPGRPTIIASQTGNAGYHEAVPVSQSFCIRPIKPIITLSGVDTESPVLTSSANEGNQWFLNGTVISGATNTTFHATQPGVYNVQVKVDDCVSDFSADQPLIITGVGKNLDDNMKIEVYPNPASDRLHISFGGIPGKKDVSIFQLNGIKTTWRQVDRDEATFEVADYPRGMYVVHVKSGNKVRLIRFIKH